MKDPWTPLWDQQVKRVFLIPFCFKIEDFLISWTQLEKLKKQHFLVRNTLLRNRRCIEWTVISPIDPFSVNHLFYSGYCTTNFTGKDKSTVQVRRQRGGNAPPIFVFAPPIFFAPHGMFLGGRSWCFGAKKTLKFAISARKSLRISAKTFAPLILILPPPISWSWRRPWHCYNFPSYLILIRWSSEHKIWMWVCVHLCILKKSTLCCCAVTMTSRPIWAKMTSKAVKILLVNWFLIWTVNAYIKIITSKKRFINWHHWGWSKTM